MPEVGRFNLRVYALIIKGNQILVCDEQIDNFFCTKFPGGGVEFGEGLLDALKRELFEEAEILANTIEHFYTTDFFQLSAFNVEEQIISVYYLVQTDVQWLEKGSDQSVGNKKHLLHLNFKNIEDLRAEDLTFPIDKHVLFLLQKKISG